MVSSTYVVYKVFFIEGATSSGDNTVHCNLLTVNLKEQTITLYEPASEFTSLYVGSNHNAIKQKLVRDIITLILSFILNFN